MNEDILKGSWLEIKGRVKEKWGKLTDNELGEIEGKGEKLLGRLRKQYGYIRDKTELEYKDSVALAENISSISKIMKKTDFIAIAFIARYGKPLLAKHQESKTSVIEKKHGYNTDRYFDSRLSRRNTPLVSR
jgi:uncharacterized protein YjbJ (UPF0337 family)